MTHRRPPATCRRTRTEACVAGQAARIAGAVETLVVLPGDGAERRQASRERQHPLVRYGCSRTRSSSGRVRLAGLSQTAFDTPRRPMSWTNAARRRPGTSACGNPPDRPASAASSATPRAWPISHGDLSSANSPIAESASSSSIPLTTAASDGSESITRSQLAAVSRSPKISGARRAEHVDQVRIELRAAALAGDGKRRIDATGTPEHLPHRRRLTPDVASLQLAGNRAERPATWIGDCPGHGKGCS